MPVTSSVVARALVALTMASSLHAEAPAPEAKRARALNDRGHALHVAGKLEEGLAAFRAAVEADANYALAHYNLACALARLRAAGKTCEVDAYRGTIMEHLERAIDLDPKRRERARVDEDLRAVRDTLAFQRVVWQRQLATVADRRAVLVAVSWFGPSPGAYGPTSAIDFSDDGSVGGWQLVFDDEGAPRRAPLAGRFTVSEHGIELRLEGAAAASKATLSWDGLEVGGTRYTDDPDDCSA